MIKFILTLAVYLLFYAGCIVWITWDVKLEAIDKILICWFGLVPIGGAAITALSFDWFEND